MELGHHHIVEIELGKAIRDKRVKLSIRELQKQSMTLLGSPRDIYTLFMLIRLSSPKLGSVFALIGVLLTARQQWGEGTELSRIHAALAAMDLSPTVVASIQAKIDAAPQPLLHTLSAIMMERKTDPMLLYRVDKAKALPDGYAPPDLVPLDGADLSVSRTGHRLRKAALQALKAMYVAARADNVTLLVSSSYRSYAYQVEVWNRGVAAEGEAETAASVARPGHSQHQLGTALDFGSITDTFAESKASHWLMVNAHRFGFSLSFPQGMSSVTGYKWESWHYRYIGKSAASLEQEYFGGIQQYLLLFLEKL
jgi:zinc D-Ala-D-Ala carboxypeptidase